MRNIAIAPNEESFVDAKVYGYVPKDTEYISSPARLFGLKSTDVIVWNIKWTEGDKRSYERQSILDSYCRPAGITVFDVRMP